MTDNARQFVCSNFTDFSRAWDFEHIRNNPCDPQSNGLEERAVRSAKHLLEKCYREQSDIQSDKVTARGFDKLAVVQGLASQPNSYVVTSQGRQDTTNRRLLLLVQEPAPTECAEDDYSSFSPASPPTTPLSSAVLPSQSEAPTTGAVAQTAQLI